MKTCFEVRRQATNHLKQTTYKTNIMLGYSTLAAAHNTAATDGQFCIKWRKWNHYKLTDYLNSVSTVHPEHYRNALLADSDPKGNS